MDGRKFRKYLGKEGLYFHAASNDRVADPDHKKILPPSPEHPFFVTTNPCIANKYINLSTDDDGRVTDDELEYDDLKNARMYVLRLNDDVDKTGHYFDFSKEDQLRKLRPLFSFQEGYDKFCERLLGDKKNFFTVCLGMSNIDDDFHQDLTKASEDEIKRRCDPSKFIHGSSEYMYSMIYGSLCHHFKNLDRIPNRRELKAVFFRYILETLHVKVIGEFNTWNGNQESGIVEFGILDMSVIKDVYPFPITQDCCWRAAILPSMYSDAENTFHYSKAEQFMTMVNFLMHNKRYIKSYGYEQMMKDYMKFETERREKLGL